MSHPVRSAAVPVARAASAILLLACACGKGKQPSITPNTAGWWRDHAAYEIFVRSFADSDGDGIGDLKGVTAHLDDLNDGNPATTTDLGVDAIWLMPIFPSPSYHGYDVTDYRSVNPQYGTLDDFAALAKAAHQRGIKVLLDMVLNHSSSQHPWFANSVQGATADKRDWYHWSATDPGWRKPWDGSAAWYPLGGSYFYGIFCPCMPDLNLGNPAVEAELVSTMKFWLAQGADGFRLDAARYFFPSPTGALADQPETHAFLQRIRLALQTDYPDALLVAEAWAPQQIASTYYGNGDEVQLAFAFDLAAALKSSASSGDGSAAVNELARAEATLAGKDLGFLAPFLSNHDQVRTLRAIGGDPGAARVAAAALLAMPGTPFIYYGEEIGMQGEPDSASSDRSKRTPIRWTPSAPGYGFTNASSSWYGTTTELAGVDVASQRANPGSLWNEYRTLLALRHARAALTAGDATFPPVGSAGPVPFALLRTAGTSRVLFVANFSTAATPAFTIAAPGTPHALQSEGLAGAPTASGGQLSFPGLAARGFAFFSLD